MSPIAQLINCTLKTDAKATPWRVTKTAKMVAANAAHLASLLKASGIATGVALRSGCLFHA